jgi:putative transposase
VLDCLYGRAPHRQAQTAYDTPEQFRALRQTQLAYRNALNHVSLYAFAHGKMSNQIALRERTYLDVHARFGPPAQMATNVPRQVSATYKGLWTKVKANAAARAAGKTKKRYRGLDQAPKYVSSRLAYDYQRDYRFKTGQQVSVLTLQGRVIVPYSGYTAHVAFHPAGYPDGRPHRGSQALV